MARECRGRIGLSGALVLLTLGIFVSLAAAPGTTAALAGCPHANAKPRTTSLANIRKAMRCLVNNKRVQHGRERLQNNTHLAKAAQRHTKVMLRKDCFEHRCPGEAALGKRIKRSGYIDGAKNYYFAEDLGFDHTPRRMIRRLMHSKYNRKNILGPDWCDIGVGAGWGAPKKSRDDRKFETFTILFAWRGQKC